jgi:glycosyltransferase involved in cell wall biosynthesis
LLVHERRASDRQLRMLLERARCTAFPSRAEGCGLPVLESLWAGRPCLASEIEAVRESAIGGGCELLPPHDGSQWAHALDRMLFDDAHWLSKAREAVARPLPRWEETAAAVWRACR